jgi:3-oxoacyl-[acyl-carrier protein] reductase
MDLGIEGRWALVGGASKGLGFGCAQALVEEGVHVAIVARGQTALAEASDRLEKIAATAAKKNGFEKPVIMPIAADITTTSGRAQIIAAQSRFDIVVTNAGGPPPGDFRNWDREAWLAAIDANMLTPIELIRSQIDAMAQRGYGRIINITSSAVKAPIDILGLSNGARSGLTGFVAGLARSSIATQGVTINNLLPGVFDTDRLKQTLQSQAKNLGADVEEVRQKRIATVPSRRLGTADEFGRVCAFLCSTHAGYITGQNILIDGGAYQGSF